MNTIKKILLGGAAVIAVAAAAFFMFDRPSDPEQNSVDTPDAIVADYKELLAEAEQLKTSAGDNCENKKSVDQQLEALTTKLADLANRKMAWLDSVPPLPELTPEMMGEDNPLGRPGSEVPELSSDVPPLPDIDSDLIVVDEVPGSQVPELSSDVPPLPDVKIEVIESEYIPELPELPGTNTGRPGSEVPELTSDVPPLPEIDDMNIIDPNENIYQIETMAEKINSLLQELKVLCQKEDAPAKKKVISDKCSDACQRHKDCSAYTEDVTAADLDDAYNACMEECPSWSKEIITCINAIDIKTPGDCVSFVNCQVPQYFEEKYLP